MTVRTKKKAEVLDIPKYMKAREHLNHPVVPLMIIEVPKWQCMETNDSDTGWVPLADVT